LETPKITGPDAGEGLPEKPAAFLFDVYGTLLVPAPPAGEGPGSPWKALSLLMDRFSLNRNPEDLCRALREETAAEHARMKERGIDFPEVEIDRIWQRVLETGDRDFARRFALAFEMMVNPVRPSPGAAGILSAIRKRKIPAGIVSNAQFYTGQVLKRFFGDLPQDAWADPELIFYSFEHGRAKPSPYLFEQAAACLARKGIPARNALHVGNDPDKDVAPASGAGFRTALLAGDGCALPLTETAGRKPDLVITALDQLEKFIG
jgi:putative hydrolase of the HAD superfamily